VGGECDALDAIETEVASAPNGLFHFRYRAVGDLRKLRIPERTAPDRASRLWQHTCFELFITGSGASYFEFNFSPSTQWAAYKFDAYRQAMSALALPSAPRISFAVTPDTLVLDAAIDLQRLLDPQARSRPRMALAAVIEDRDGRLCYWALAHPDGEPDFHHRDGFIAGLPDNGG